MKYALNIIIVLFFNTSSLSNLFAQCNPVLTHNTNNSLCSGDILVLTASPSLPTGCQVSSSTGTPYQWSGPATSVPSPTSTNTITIVAADVGTYYVQVQIEDDGSGTCSCTGGSGSIALSQPSNFIVINEEPSIPIVNPPITCPNGQATLTASSGSGTTGSFYWYDGASSTANLLYIGNPFIVSNVTSSNNSFWVEEHLGNCISPSRFLVSIPVIAISPPFVQNDTICSGSTTVLNVNSGGGLLNSTFNWYADNLGQNLIFQGNSFTTPSLTNSRSYWVSEVGNNCESPLVEVQVTVNNLLPPITNPVNICPGTSTSINVNSSNPQNTTIHWFSDINGTNLLHIGNTLTTPILFNDTTFYVQEVLGLCGSSIIATHIITGASITPPSIDISSTLEICEETSGIIIAKHGDSSQTGNFEWYNSPTNGNLLFIGNIFNSLPLTDTTMFWVEENEGGCRSNRTAVSIYVNQKPVKPILSSTNSYCEGDTLRIIGNNLPSSNQRYSWFGPNGFFIGNTPNITIEIPNISHSTHEGIYFAQIQNQNTGCLSDTGAVVVTIIQTPQTPSVTGNLVLCEGDTLNLTADSVYGATSYTWIPPSGPVINTSTPYMSLINVQILNAGTYGIRANTGNCQSLTGTNFVQIKNSPSVPYIFIDSFSLTNDSTFCEGDNIELNTLPISNTFFSWSGPNNFASVTPKPVIINFKNAQQGGIYTLNVTHNGCSNTNSILLNATPQPFIDSFTVDLVCEGDTLDLYSVNLGAVTYSWLGQNGFNANGSTIKIPNISETDHQGNYTLTIQDTISKCTASISQYIDIHPQPSPPTIVTNSPICAGEVVNLSATSSINNLIFEWNGPNNFIALGNNISISGTQSSSGIYQVRAISQKNCYSLKTNTFVKVNPIPNVSISNDTTVEQGSFIQLHALGGQYYEWSSPIIFFENNLIPNPTTLNLETIGSHMVYLEVTNHNGCTSNRELEVKVINREELKIYDILTPNGDGMNDFWKIDYLENYDDYIIQVFNQAGDIVYHYTGRDYPSQPWEGTNSNNKILPNGTYAYIIELKNPTLKSKIYKGPISIIGSSN